MLPYDDEYVGFLDENPMKTHITRFWNLTTVHGEDGWDGSRERQNVGFLAENPMKTHIT